MKFLSSFFKVAPAGLVLCGLIVFFFKPASVPSPPDLQLPHLSPLAQAFDGVTTASSKLARTQHEPLSGRTIQAQSPQFQRTYAIESLGIHPIDASNNHALMAAVKNAGEIWKSEKTSTAYVFYRRDFDQFIEAAKARIDSENAEGRWDFEKQHLIPGMDGYKVVFSQTLANLKQAILSEAPAFAIAIETKPSFSKEASDFTNFKPEKTLARFSTTFTRSKNRTINVKLAAAALNGLFLAPQASFSYNDLVGERSEARGFKDAPVIEQGQLVEGLGGGACQVSSTVHAAALLGGLNILERYNHSLPSSYIDLGLDAVVSYPILDLRIQNPFQQPVVLQVTTQDNTLIATWLSNFEPPKAIFRKEIIEEIPYKEIISTDPNLPEGTHVIRKRGKVGYKVQRGRILWQDGKESFQRLNLDIYQPQTQHVSIALNTPYPLVGD